MTPFQPRKPLPPSLEDENRLEKLFDRSHQLESEEQRLSERETKDSLICKMAALTTEDATSRREEQNSDSAEGNY